MVQTSNRIIASAVVLAAGMSAQGYEFRVRFVERVGDVDTVLAGNAMPNDGLDHRIRVQIGVFDDADGPAPAGGIVGWIDGVQHNDGLVSVRTPGRLGVFVHGEPGQDGNGFPGEDPFIHVTNIDAVMGPQSLVWTCVGGVPMKMPPPVIRGRNTFVSVWEVTVRASHRCNAVLTFSGDVLAASSWEIVGTPEGPTCTEPPSPTTVVYEPVLLPRGSFTAEMYVVVGPPGKPPYPCPSDWNFDFVVNSQDFFDYVGDFLAGRGQFNCEGGIDSQDFFDFLAAFFSGC